MTRHLDPDLLAAIRHAQIQSDGIRHLWQAVLCTAVADARAAQQRIGTPKEIPQPTHKAFEADRDALAWLASADCRWVASAAGYDPAFVERKLCEAGHFPEKETTK